MITGINYASSRCPGTCTLAGNISLYDQWLVLSLSASDRLISIIVLFTVFFTTTFGTNERQRRGGGFNSTRTWKVSEVTETTEIGTLEVNGGVITPPRDGRWGLGFGWWWCCVIGWESVIRGEGAIFIDGCAICTWPVPYQIYLNIRWWKFIHARSE